MFQAWEPFAVMFFFRHLRKIRILFFHFPGDGRRSRLKFEGIPTRECRLRLKCSLTMPHLIRAALDWLPRQQGNCQIDSGQISPVSTPLVALRCKTLHLVVYLIPKGRDIFVCFSVVWTFSGARSTVRAPPLCISRGTSTNS